MICWLVWGWGWGWESLLGRAIDACWGELFGVELQAYSCRTRQFAVEQAICYWTMISAVESDKTAIIECYTCHQSPIVTEHSWLSTHKYRRWVRQLTLITDPSLPGASPTTNANGHSFLEMSAINTHGEIFLGVHLNAFRLWQVKHHLFYAGRYSLNAVHDAIAFCTCQLHQTCLVE